MGEDSDNRGSAAEQYLQAQAAVVLEGLSREPDSPELRRELLAVCDKMFSAPLDISPDPSRDLSGRVLVQVNQFALAGDAGSLKALMRAALGPYGKTTAEGSEWLNEMLWHNFETNPQLTLDTLGEIPSVSRDELMAQVYTRPIHDGFDFQKIHTAISTSTRPAELSEEVGRIIEIIQVHLPDEPPGDN